MRLEFWLGWDSRVSGLVPLLILGDNIMSFNKNIAVLRLTAGKFKLHSKLEIIT